MTSSSVGVGCDTLRGTTKLPLDEALERLSWVAVDYEGNFNVEALNHGSNGYSKALKVHLAQHHLTVFYDGSADMGILINIGGAACAELGHKNLITIYAALELRASRIDIAVDHCPFAVSQVKDAWLANKVRSHVKARAENSKPGRENTRTHKFITSPSGDTFYMGSRTSMRFGRVYDEKGYTRFELECKSEYADQVAQQIFAVSDCEEILQLSLGLFQDFVQFVEPAAHSRDDVKLSWWKEFTEGVAKKVIQLPEKAARTILEAADCLEHQFGPLISTIAQALGPEEILRIAKRSSERISRQQKKMLSAFRYGPYQGSQAAPQNLHTSVGQPSA